MPYKLRVNKRRSKRAFKKDYKYYNKSQDWEEDKKHKRVYRRKLGKMF